MGFWEAIDLLFGGMEKLGPGSDADTLRVLGLIPEGQNRIVVDAGCGTGRQTLVLAKQLGKLIHAVDIHEPFLGSLVQRAGDAGLKHLIKVHCMDIKNIPKTFPRIDLLWSEAAAYNIGFSNALEVWAKAVKPRGYAAVSEMVWLREQVPDAVREFFQKEYPDMKSVQQNIAIAENAGYRVLATHMLARETWVEGYYDVLEGRAKDLLDHPDAAVRDLAAGMIREIEVFEISEDSYGYMFYLLQRGE